MTTFQSLGELGAYVEQQSPPVRVVDPGIPLLDYAGGSEFGDVWASQPSVRKVTDFIARNVASLSLHTFDRVSDTDRRRVTDHPLPALLSSPGGEQSKQFRFWHAIIVDWLLFDRWAALKVTDAATMRLVRVPARRFRFEHDSLDQVTAVQVWGSNGKSTDYDPAKFVWDTGYSERGASGTSPMRTLRHLLEEYAEAVAYRREVWKNQARVPTVLTWDKHFQDDAARQRFAASWSAFIRGGNRAGGTPVLEDGMALAKLDAFKPQDTGDLEGRRLTDIEVASAYHIAPELVGARQGTYSNVDAYRQMLYRESLGPYITAWEQAINIGLVPDLAPGTRFYVEANLEAKLRGSFEEQAKIMQAATGAPWLLRSEARGRMNLPEIPGADELVVPLNVLVGGQASPQDSAPPTSLAGPRRQVKSRPPETHVTKHTQVLSGFFERQARVVKTALGVKAAADWWDAARWDRELAADLYRLAALTSEAVAAATLERLGFSADDYDPDRTFAYLLAMAERVAGAVNATTKAQLDGALDGDDPDDGVLNVFAIAAASRAAQLAATYATTTAGFGTVEAAKQLAGGAATKTWITGPNPRPGHAGMNGETVGIEEPFSNGAMWPGDGPTADEAAGCNCSVEVEIPEPA